ncbi:hypothetical protein ACFL7M_15465 [Thermodesulfobacteriota bacterium]
MCVSAYHLRACLGVYFREGTLCSLAFQQHGKLLIDRKNLKAHVGLVVGVDVPEDPVTVCCLSLHRKRIIPVIL